MRRALFPIAVVLFLSACGTVGGKPFVRAYAAGDRAYSAGRFLEAADDYEQAAKTAERPRDREEALYAAAEAHERAGDIPGALSRYDALAKEKGGERSIRAKFRAAELRIAHGEEKRGYSELEEILKEAPEHGMARRSMLTIANHIEATQGKDAAIAWLEKLAKDNAGNRLGEEASYESSSRREANGDDKGALAGFLACATAYPYPKGALWDDSLFRASLLHEKLGDVPAAIADLERMLADREKSYASGSYNRPRMPSAQFRIAELQRDKLGNKAAARASFHRVYVEHPTSVLRARALFFEGELARDANDGSSACSLARKLLDEFKDTRWARKSDQLCPAVAAEAEALRKERADKRAKAAAED
ncbi:MAG: tetratricopeptide repeat protein [Polyangiales bacterium]